MKLNEHLKKRGLLIFSLLIIFIVINSAKQDISEDVKISRNSLLSESGHPDLIASHIAKKLRPDDYPEIKKISKEESIRDRYQHEFDMTKDPASGEIPKDVLFRSKMEAIKQAREYSSRNPIPNVQWTERGPNNVGGRTRAIMFDPTDNSSKKVWAGGVGGGIWYSNDITNSSANWKRVDDFWSNMAVTSIDHDPVNTSTFYVGTGEGFGNADAISGDGIWKTTDGGSSWQHLSNTTNFGNSNKIICWKANHVLVATSKGLQISTNGGSTWTNRYPSYNMADAEVSKDGDLYVSTFNGDVWKSFDDGATWPYARNGSEGRVEISTAPSDNNVIYATINSGSDVIKILRSGDRGNTWVEKTVPKYKEQGSCNFGSQIYTRGQGWYDLISLVKPNDPNTIIIGGIDLLRSQDGGLSWETISYWTGACDTYVHADQHALASRPGYPNEIVSGNDGGVYYSPNAMQTGSNPSFDIQVDDYNVTQFFAVALHPSAGVNNFIAGAQDNGTRRMTGSGIGGSSYVSGGDGAFCHIDQDNPNIQISSYVRNNYYYTNSGGTFNSYSIDNSGRFINPTDYDNDANILYACADADQYLRVTGFGGNISHSFVSASAFNGQISCVKVSPNVENRVYFGINNNKICRIDNANSQSPTLSYLGQPSSGYPSSIDVERGNENHILITYSNYNVTSVFESVNGGASWSPVEGDLPNMPIRWGVFAPNNADQAILATELGVWTTDNLNGSNTDWDPTNTNLANTRVDMIEYRTSDNLVAAATHGRGLFTSNSFAGDPPCVISSATAGSQSCDPNTNTYSQIVTIGAENTPSSGNIIINGQSFSFPTNASSMSESYTLIGLTPNGQAIDLNVSFSSEGSCTKTFSQLFEAPNANCSVPNVSCNTATIIQAPGIIECDGIEGSNCVYCEGDADQSDWYVFTPESNGTLTVKSCGGGADTRLIIYSGSCNSLTRLGVNDDFCSMGPGTEDYASQLIVDVVEDVNYYIEWDDRWSNSGFDFELVFEADVECTVANKLFVDSGKNANGIGCSWSTAYKYLQDAIDAAESSNNITEIWLKAGKHLPGKQEVTVTRFKTFETEESVAIYGGFTGTETQLSQRDPENNITILSGDIGVVNDDSDNIFNIVTHRTTKILTLDGLTIEEGEETSGNDWSGAAIWNTGKMSIKNCKLKGNHATSTGSAIYNRGSSAEIIVEDLEFEGNTGVDFLNTQNAKVIIQGQIGMRMKE